MKKKISITAPYDKTKAVKRLARERVGQPHQEKVIVPKKARKPKHKKIPADIQDEFAP